MQSKKSLILFLISLGMYLFMIIGLGFPIVRDSYYGYAENGFTFLGFNSYIVTYGWAVGLIGVFCWAILGLAVYFSIMGIIKFVNGQKIPAINNIGALIAFCFYGFLGIVVAIVCKATYGSYFSFFTFGFFATIIGVGGFIAYKVLDKKLVGDMDEPVNNTPKTTSYQLSVAQPTSAYQNSAMPTPTVDENGEKVVFNQLKGAQKILTVYEDRLSLTQIKNLRTVMTHDLFKGTKEVMFSNLLAVQYKPASNVILGYLQFELPGSGTGDNFGSENSWTFYKEQNEIAKQVCDYIKKRMKELKTPQASVIQNQLSPAEELKKFKELLDAGIITQEEFDKKKSDLLK